MAISGSRSSDSMVNAVQHQQGEGHVALVLKGDEAAGTFSLVVDDDGRGMPEDLLASLDVEGFRTDAARQRGPGLGMVIAAEIARRAGWTLTWQPLEPTGTLGIAVKLVEPGGVKTDFAGRSFVFTHDPGLADYQPLVDAYVAAMKAGTPSGSQEPEDVAEVVWSAVTDGTDQLRYISGDGAKALLGKRYSAEQDEAFVAGLRKQFGL